MTPVFVACMTRYEQVTAPWFKEDRDDVRLSIQGQERRLVELIDLLKALSLEKPGRYPC